MSKKSKDQRSLLNVLEKQKLPVLDEQKIIDMAVERIKNKENEYQVKNDLILSLNKLAIKGNLSKEGIQLLTELNRPNFNEDVAISSMTWF